MGQLADLAKKRSPFLTLEEGESVVGLYLGYKMIPNSFNPKEEQFQFIIVVDGSEKFFNTSSNKVAFAFDKIEENAKVKITKVFIGMRGDKRKYSYEIEEVVDEDGKVSKKAAKKMEEEMAG